MKKHGYGTSDQAPVLQGAGHGTRLQARRLSGLSPLQYLLCTERLVPSWRNCTQRTVRIWKPRPPQVLGQFSQSSEIHLRREGRGAETLAPGQTGEQLSGNFFFSDCVFNAKAFLTR